MLHMVVEKKVKEIAEATSQAVFRGLLERNRTRIVRTVPGGVFSALGAVEPQPQRGHREKLQRGNEIHLSQPPLSFKIYKMSSAIEIASTIQSASLNRHPSPAHDLNPSTAASSKQPVSPTISTSSGENSIPYSALKPVPRSSNLPPLPDLRFEQSYLASLRGVEGWGGVLWVTARDQVRRENSGDEDTY